MSALGGRSGAIVNLTLMEVFIVVAFMFIIYAAQSQTETDDEIRRLRASVAELQRQLAEAQLKLQHAEVALGTCNAELRKCLGPPRCPPYGPTRSMYGTVELLPGGELRVEVPKHYEPDDFEGTATLSRQAFRRRFAPLFALTKEQGCRLPVRVIPTTQDMDEYKLSLAEVKQVFYSAGELQR